jgi:hypothetical protein
MIGGGVMALRKEEGGEVEVMAEAEAVARWKVGIRKVGVVLEVVSALLFTGQGRTELEGAGDGESDEDEDAGVLVL